MMKAVKELESGVDAETVAREHGISRATLYNWNQSTNYTCKKKEPKHYICCLITDCPKKEKFTMGIINYYKPGRKIIIVSALVICYFGTHSCTKEVENEELEIVEDICTKMDDIEFMDYCYTTFDVNKDGKVSMSEAAAIREIRLNKKDVVSLKGIEYFTTLSVLCCDYNKLTSINLSRNTALTKLECNSNQLTSINLSRNKELTYLSCWGNKLSSLDLSKSSSLGTLYCQNNLLKTLDITKNSALESLALEGNQLTSLDLTNSSKLRNLVCRYNNITQLDVSTTALFPQGMARYYDIFSEINDKDGKELTLIVSNSQYQLIYHNLVKDNLYSRVVTEEDCDNYIKTNYNIILKKN